MPVEALEWCVGRSWSEIIRMVLDELDGCFTVTFRGLWIVEDLLDVMLIVCDVGFAESEPLSDVTVVESSYYWSGDLADVDPSSWDGFAGFPIAIVSVDPCLLGISCGDDEVFVGFRVRCFVRLFPVPIHLLTPLLVMTTPQGTPDPRRGSTSRRWSG